MLECLNLVALTPMQHDAKNLEKDVKKTENLSRWKATNKQALKADSRNTTGVIGVCDVYAMMQVLEAVLEVQEAVEGEREIRQRQIVDGSRALAEKLTPDDRASLLRFCNDVDELTKALTQLRKKGKVGKDAQARRNY